MHCFCPRIPLIFSFRVFYSLKQLQKLPKVRCCFNDLILISSYSFVFQQVVDNVKDFINQQAMVDELMQECQKIATRITRAIKNVANFREVYI